jgi:hypothetical protein
MARTIATIKADLATQFMANSDLIALYNKTIKEEADKITVGDSFDSHFSKVSFESIWLYICAYCAYVIEVLFDTHKTEVTALIDGQKPHTRNWYETKAKAFMFGYSLVDGEDSYGTSDLTDAEITAAQVVKYAAAVEKSGVVYLKIAGGSSGSRAPVTVAQKTAFESYIKDVKDAGVVVSVVNTEPQHFRLTMTVYYDPMVLDATGMKLADGTYPVTEAIASFIDSLEFNGEYRNAALVDALQDIDGVVIPELHLAELSADGSTWTTIDAKATPDSGYCKIYNDTDLNITYTAYQSISV